MKYLDLFSGAGGFRAAFEQVPGMECVGFCEIDPRAVASYRALFDTEGEWFTDDARKIDTGQLPAFDLVCGGFPCQSFSVAGQRKGFEDARGTLFFEIARILGARKPAFVLLENVPGLLSHDEGRTFNIILGALSGLGYHVEWQVLNSADFGVPQSRKRVFIVGYTDRRCAGKILPLFGANGKALIQLAGGPQGLRVYDPEGVACTQTSAAGGKGGKTGLYFVGSDGEQTAVQETDGPCFVDLCYGHPKLTNTARCLTAHYSKSKVSIHKGEVSGVLVPKAPEAGRTAQGGCKVLLIKEATKRGYKEALPGDTIDLGYAGSNTRRGRVGRNIAHTLDTGRTQGVFVKNGRIRHLTPRECFRLQGFTDEQIDTILAITSDAQAYKQAGNGVTVNVVYAIGLKIKAAWDEICGESAGELGC